MKKLIAILSNKFNLINLTTTSDCLLDKIKINNVYKITILL